MLHIAICDDETEFVTYLSRLLDRYADENGEEIKVSCYSDGSDLIARFDMTIDLVFLDIQMKEMNGLEAAGRLRQMDEKVGIIFLTTMVQYGLEGYKYRAADYILKPIKYIRLKVALDNWKKNHIREDQAAVTVKNDSGTYKILLKNLRYVETFNRNLLLHTNQEKIISYRSMKEMEKELKEDGFVRCHTSYLVNLLYIKGVKKLELELITGEIIPISQPKRKQVMERLAEEWGDLL